MSLKKCFTIFLVSFLLFLGSNAHAFDYSLKFDGIDDYVDCGDDASLNFGTGDFSFETWFQGDSDYYYQLLIAKSYEEKLLSLYNGKANFYIYDGIDYAEVEAPTPVNDGEWHHLVGTRSSSTIMIYVDGDYKAQTDASAVGNTDSVENLTIGSNASSTLMFEGLIDKVRIYNRVLSPTEIDEHYNGIFENETGLKLYLPLDEGKGSIAYDYSGQGNNGTIYGATYYPPPIVEVSTNFATTTLAYAGDLFTDLSVPIIMIVGLPMGFWVIRKIISLVRVR